MSLFHRSYNSKERLWERFGELEDKLEKLEARFQALSDLLEVAYKDGPFSSTQALRVVPKEKDK